MSVKMQMLLIILLSHWGKKNFFCNDLAWNFSCPHGVIFWTYVRCGEGREALKFPWTYEIFKLKYFHSCQ